MKLRYEDIEVGDIVCAKTESNDIDVKTLGRVSKKLGKSDYELMKVIYVDHFYQEKQNYYNYGLFAPQDLIKLDVKQLYHIILCDRSWSKFENIPIRRS